MAHFVVKSLEDSVSAVRQLLVPESIAFIEKLGSLLAKTFARGNKVIIAGNGGSLCDAAHFAEELTGYFREPRQALPAIALSEPGHLTCVGNDAGFDHVFARGVEAFGKVDDVFIALTTSGNSPNIVHAVHKAVELGLTTVCFLGKGGGKLQGVADLELIINGYSTSDRIQEAHMTAIHVSIEVMEKLLFQSETNAEDQPSHSVLSV